MIFALARRVLKTRVVTVGHPCGIGDLAVERIAGFHTSAVATTAEYRRYLRERCQDGAPPAGWRPSAVSR